MSEKAPSHRVTAIMEQPRAEREDTAEHERVKAAFEDVLEDIALRVPEVEERKVSLIRGGAELIEVFGVQSEFFEDDSRSMLFVSLAGNAAHLNGLPPSERNFKQQDFIATATFLLTADYSTEHPDLQEAYNNQMRSDEVSEDHVLRVYDKYTDKPTTREVVGKIKREGYLEDVAEKLGVGGEPTEAVDIRILNIGTGAENFDFKLAENDVSYQEAQAWAHGLEVRSEEFARDMIDRTAKLAARAAGFTANIHGQEMLMLPRGKAEILLADDHDVELSAGAGVDRVIATIKHEFTHNHGNVRVGEHFGFAVEERRAEYFSGDKSEYFEVKKMFNELAMLDGVHVKELFDKVAEAKKRGEKAVIYEELANAYGLDLTISIAAAMPAVYIPYTKSEYARNMLESGIKMEDIGSEFAKGIQESDKTAARGRLAETLKRLINLGVSRGYMKMHYAPIARTLNVKVEDVLDSLEMAA